MVVGVPSLVGSGETETVTCKPEAVAPVRVAVAVALGAVALGAGLREPVPGLLAGWSAPTRAGAGASCGWRAPRTCKRTARQTHRERRQAQMAAITVRMAQGAGPGEAAAAAAGIAVLAVLVGEDSQGGRYAALVAMAEQQDQEALRRERNQRPRG